MTLADKEQSKRKLHSTLTSSSPSSPKVVKLIKGRHAPIQHIRGSGGVCWVFFLQTHSDEALQTSRKPKPSGGTEIFGNRHLCFQLSTNQPRKKLPSDHGVFLTFFFLRVMHTFSAITFYLTSVSHFTARPAEAHHLGRGGGGGGSSLFAKWPLWMLLTFTSSVKYISFLCQRIKSAVCRTMLVRTTWKRLPKPFG